MIDETRTLPLSDLELEVIPKINEFAERQVFVPQNGLNVWCPAAVTYDDNLQVEVDSRVSKPYTGMLDSAILNGVTVRRHDECLKPKKSLVLHTTTQRPGIFPEPWKNRFRVVVSSFGHVYVFAGNKLCTHHLISSRIVLRDVYFTTGQIQMYATDVYWTGPNDRWFKVGKDEVTV